MQTQTTIGAFEAKTHFGQFLERAQGGEFFTITKHGLPVAQLTPISDPAPNLERVAAVAKMKAFSKRGFTLGPGLTLRALREEGRR